MSSSSQPYFPPAKHHWLVANIGDGSDDAAIVPALDGVSIACGGHAGDATTMKKALSLAKKYQIMAGAHPSYPDRETFGRLSMVCTHDELKRMVLGQIRELEAIADKLHYPLTFVKPHGALNHDICRNHEMFSAICAAVAKANPNYLLFAPIGNHQSAMQTIAEEYNIKICWSVFADRVYQPDGLLLPRQEEGSIQPTAEKIHAQLQQILAHRTIKAVDGSILAVHHAEAICFHSDYPPSVKVILQLKK